MNMRSPNVGIHLLHSQKFNVHIHGKNERIHEFCVHELRSFSGLCTAEGTRAFD